MECREAVAAMTEDLSGGLSAPAQRALASHVEGCAACADQRQAHAEIWALLGAPDDEGDSTGEAPAGEAASDRGNEISAGFAARTIPRLRAAATAAAARRRARRLRQVVGGIGASLALAAGIALVVRTGQHQPGGAGNVVAEPARPRASATTGSSSAAPKPPEAAPAELPLALAAYVANQLADGSRGQAISLVGTHFGGAQAEPPAELIAALTRTLRSDRNPGVRKKAAQALLGLQPCAEIRAAFIQVLRKDRNPAIRIIAIEALGRAARAFDPDSIETLRERADDQKEGQNLRTRAARALRTLAL